MCLSSERYSFHIVVRWVVIVIEFARCIRTTWVSSALRGAWRDFVTGDDGSVLMETVVALPLYFILLGGIFWIGDLTLTRQKAVIADRYVAWNGANAHGGTQAGSDMTSQIAEKMYAASTGVNVNTCSFQKNPLNHWGGVGYGAVGVNVAMPIWTKGMFAMQLVHGEQTAMTDNVNLAGRINQEQNVMTSLWHSVIMRNEHPDWYHDWTGQQLADNDLQLWDWFRDELDEISVRLGGSE